MSSRTFGQILTVAFGVSLSSLAFARNPPALVEQQQRAEQATQSGGGYRDINWRFGSVPARSPQVVHAAGGYRDMRARFGDAPSAGETAARSTPSRWR
jgi:hypothetical protein